MELKKHGQTKKVVKIKCKVDNPDARVKWYKDGIEIKPSDTRFLMENNDGELTLTIKQAELTDAGKYTCKIEEFAKEGEGETSCDVTIGGEYFVYNVLAFSKADIYNLVIVKIC